MTGKVIPGLHPFTRRLVPNAWVLHPRSTPSYPTVLITLYHSAEPRADYIARAHAHIYESLHDSAVSVQSDKGSLDAQVCAWQA